MSALKYWLWLSTLRGLGNQTRLSLLRRFPSPEEIYYADEGELLLTEGIRREEAAALADKSLRTAEKILADCTRLDIRILTIQDAEYPGRLKNIYDPPVLLYVKGRLPAFDEEAAIAVVGTRDCSPYGVACARKLGHGLAAGGAVVVSGLAKGVDAEASRAALRAGGFVVACLVTAWMWCIRTAPARCMKISRRRAPSSANIPREQSRWAGISRCETASSPAFALERWWWKRRRKAAPLSPQRPPWSRDGMCLPFPAPLTPRAALAATA